MADIYTLEQFVSNKPTNELNYYNLSILAGDSIVRYSINNVVYDYLDELKELSHKWTMNGMEYDRYKCDGVHLLAYDKYGNRELSFIILIINGIYNAKDFTKETINIIEKDDLYNFLNEVYNAEKEYINYNRESLKNKA